MDQKQTFKGYNKKLIDLVFWILFCLSVRIWICFKLMIHQSTSGTNIQPPQGQNNSINALFSFMEITYGLVELR
ncbi:MAG: hypothetical protein C4329_02660 [Chitinophagaceae bacterium]